MISMEASTYAVTHSIHETVVNPVRVFWWGPSSAADNLLAYQLNCYDRLDAMVMTASTNRLSTLSHPQQIEGSTDCSRDASNEKPIASNDHHNVSTRAD